LERRKSIDDEGAANYLFSKMKTYQLPGLGHSFAAFYTCTVKAVRISGYLMIVFSALQFLHAKYDEDRGVAAPLFVPTRYTRPVVIRGQNPAMFRALMNYEWACPWAFAGCGMILLSIVRASDRSDPFSPNFAGNKALDECESILDSKLRNKYRPLRW